MKWCRFQVGNKVSYGIVEDEARVIEVSGTPFETYTVTATCPSRKLVTCVELSRSTAR